MADTDQGKGSVKPLTGPDAGTTRYKDHEQNFLDAAKDFVQKSMVGDKAPGGTDAQGRTRSVDQAVDDAVKDTPGNSADY